MDVSPDVKKSRFWQCVQGRFIILFLVLLVPILIVQGYIHYDRWRGARARELQANLELARSVAKTFEAFVQDIVHQETAIGLALTPSQPISADEQNRILDRARANQAVIRDLAWVSPGGVIVAGSERHTIGLGLQGRRHVQKILDGADWAVSDLYRSGAVSQPVFNVARAVRNEKGDLVGIVVAVISPDRLDSILWVERSRGGGHALVDSRGRMVYRRPAIDATWEERNWAAQYPQFREALEGKEVCATVYAPFEGKTRLVGFVPVASIGWAASAGRTEEIALEPVTESLRLHVGLFLIVFLAASSAALVLSRHISNPLKRLRQHALAIGAGETTDRVEVAGPTEFQDLANAFNEMTGELMFREWKLREQREWLEVTVNSIGDAVLTTGTLGEITFLNPVAAALTGWKPEEAVGQPVQSVFRIINEKTREPAEDIVGRVMREGNVIALANHTALVTQDGREIPIEDSAAPIKDNAGNVLGVVLVFHDVTDRRRARDALQKSEAMLRAVMDQIPSGVVVRDARNGSIVLSNARSREIMRSLADDAQAFDQYRGFHPDGRPYRTEDWPVFRSIYDGEVVNAEEIECERGDGTRITLNISSAPVRDSKGRIVVGVGIFNDVTERKQMVDKIENLARFPSENPSPVLRISTDGKLLYANNSSEDLLKACGLKRAGEFPEYWRRIMGEAMESDQVREVEITAGDAIYSLLVVPVRQFGYANIYGMDITRRKRAEEALRESRSRLDAALASMTDAVFISDVRGQFIDFNDAFATFHRFKSKEECSRILAEYSDILDVFTADGQPAPLDQWAVSRALRGETVTNAEYSLRRKDTGEAWVGSYSFSPIRDRDGEIVGSVVVGRDVTELKQAEEALRKNEERLRASLDEKEVLLKEIHHRVKNNMQVISSLVSLQAGEVQDGAVRDILQEVSHRVRSMALVHEKLYQSSDLAGIEFGEYVESLLRYLWRAHGNSSSDIRLTMDLEPVSLPVNMAVPCGLILNELFSNALKHAFSGRAEGEVAVSLHRDGQGEVRLSVRDNGTGLPAGFDWQQARSLGLRLVQMLTGQLHAALEVVSGEGTEFTLTFGDRKDEQDESTHR